MTWSDTFLRTLKENDIRLVSYVPDNVLTPLIGGAAADNYFMSVCPTREDEAIGTLAGAYMGGLRGVVMMQTSGFALIANALASLIMPSQIPAILVVSSAARSASSTSARSRSRARCGPPSMPSRWSITR
jgi:sulfopyruvate decarboxylase TPP-binding subunit